MSNSLKSRLNGHFVACSAAAAAAAVGAAQKADASIVYSGIVNINIAGNIDGVYLNVVTNTTGTSGSSTAGWDINPYNGANNFFLPTGGGHVASGGAATNLAAGTVIDGTNATTTAIVTGANFPTSAPGGLYGFRFADETAGGAIRYGWAEIVRGSSTTTAGTIVRYAYENSGAGIPAGAVPAPGSLALLALGAVGLGSRRRK